ncbi:MAG: hypothetical protein A3I05_09570 [Deltaproteobacteria bacterium RIFCSPLOWO2_02_FULL_44_10]|nr:MAG: hypothetical protein A3C46_00025 [Deltaproteobacteria bacterium RIFCSPHIGHO2_02_FULL_44_16]OGQ46815.1 MAG: hypothetical protein A3I05_09570 [Deltaproteobacteria bacterium RIFCSPLOWO2_02_FULL_44_10]
MIYFKKCFFNTPAEIYIRSVIHDVRGALRESKISKGLVTVQTPESGAGFFIGEPLDDLLKQFKAAAELFPGEGVETKTKRKEIVSIGPRVKAEMFGRALSLPFEDEKLMLAPREEIMLIDFEAREKRREFLVHVFGETPETKTPPTKQPAPRR